MMSFARIYKAPLQLGFYTEESAINERILFMKKNITKQISMEEFSTNQPKKKEKKIDFALLSDEELMKYEIAHELGLFSKVMEDGWRSLSSKESGKIGGILSSRKRK